MCPSCSNEFILTDEELDSEEEVICPSCGEKIEFDFDCDCDCDCDDEDCDCGCH